MALPLQRSVTCVNCALEEHLLTYLLTYSCIVGLRGTVQQNYTEWCYKTDRQTDRRTDG